jgi:hypothetical protein
MLSSSPTAREDEGKVASRMAHDEPPASAAEVTKPGPQAVTSEDLGIEAATFASGSSSCAARRAIQQNGHVYGSPVGALATWRVSWALRWPGASDRCQAFGTNKGLGLYLGAVGAWHDPGEPHRHRRERARAPCKNPTGPRCIVPLAASSLNCAK